MTASAVWLSSWLRGAAASDDVLEALAELAPDAPAVVSLQGDAPAPLPELLVALRAAGATSVWLLLPRPGRTIGWPPGAPDVPTPAVLLGRGELGVSLLRHAPSGWRLDPLPPAPLVGVQAQMLTPRAGARALADAVTSAAERLERLGLDRPATRPQPRSWERTLMRLPEALDAQFGGLLARLATLHDALDLAGDEDGAAVTAGEALARSAELQAVLGQVEDIIVGLVGGLNAPSGITAGDTRSATAADRPA